MPTHSELPFKEWNVIVNDVHAEDFRVIVLRSAIYSEICQKWTDRGSERWIDGRKNEEGTKVNYSIKLIEKDVVTEVL